MTEMEFQLEQQKLELDRYKIDAELRWKYYDSNLDAEVDTAKMTIDAVKAENGTGDPNLQ
jgi:hypothetical protein